MDAEQEMRLQGLERILMEDHGDEFEEHDESYFAKMETMPGPTPQGKPGASRG